MKRSGLVLWFVLSAVITGSAFLINLTGVPASRIPAFLVQVAQGPVAWTPVFLSQEREQIPASDADSVPLSAVDSSACRVFMVVIDSEIHAKSARMLEKALKEAEARRADVFLMRLNTFGGALDAAEKMRTALMEAPFVTVSFIDHQAASAGALLSIACDHIVMAPGSTIGSATVVGPTGEPMPEKYQSYMRSLMRATAEETGRDPELAPQMVEGEKVLNLTTKEAVAIEFAQGQAADVEEALAVLGYEYCELDEYKETTLDKIIGFFLLPLVQALLFMGMIGGVSIELKTPGVGLPLGVAILCAIGYFSPLFLEGIARY